MSNILRTLTNHWMSEIPRKARKEILGEVNAVCPDSKSKRYHHSISEHLHGVVGEVISTEDSKYQPCNIIKDSGREAVGHYFDSKSPLVYELEVRCSRWNLFGRD